MPREHVMNGPGTAQPPPRPVGEGAATGLRVLFVALGFLAFGFLNWALLLRLALVRRRALDWVLFVVVGWVLPAVFIGITSDSDKITGPADATGVSGIIALWFCVPVYFLVMDGHYRRYAQRAAAVPQFYAAPAPYPYTPPPLPRPQPQPQPQPYGYNPYSEAPTPPPAPTPTPPPAPPRLNQVRAELDELSHLLREQEGDGR
jgi:hypothetical protein